MQYIPDTNMELEYYLGKNWFQFDSDYLSEHVIKYFPNENPLRILLIKLMHPGNTLRTYHDWEVFTYVANKYYVEKAEFPFLYTDIMDICRLMTELTVWGLFTHSLDLKPFDLDIPQLMPKVTLSDDVNGYITSMFYTRGVHAPLSFFPVETIEYFSNTANHVAAAEMLVELQDMAAGKQNEIAILEKFCYTYGQKVAALYKARIQYYGKG